MHTGDDFLTPIEEPVSALEGLMDDESPEDREARRWLAEVYQGDKVKQLSFRSITTGMLLGGVMSISNLYVGLKTGWGLGVTVTACVIAYAVFKSLEAVVPAFRRDPFTILENYTMSSAASAAGYMSSAGLVSSIPALYLATGRALTWWEMMLWLGSVSMLGVFMAIPLKRQLINIDKLPFPSGIATAETLRSMHTAGKEAMQKAQSLFAMAALGAFVALWRDGYNAAWGRVRDVWERFAIPSEIQLLPGSFFGSLLEDYTLGFEGSLIMLAAGAIIGIRVGISLLLGAVICYGVLGPILNHYQAIDKLGYKGIVMWTVWPCTSLMVTSSLLSFALRWRTVVRAFSGLSMMIGHRSSRQDPLAHIEVPDSWFFIGTGISGLACVAIGWWRFDILPWMGVLAVGLTFILSVVAARATGETDITPIGAMGKITQLTFGAMNAGNPNVPIDASITTNLMTASITAGAASHSADLLTDLKSGHLLGGNPRRQTISQFYGVIAGAFFCVPVYAILVHTPERPKNATPEQLAALPQTNLGSKEFPAPAAKVWEAVARLLSQGAAALPKGAVFGMLCGAVLGLAITLCETYLPPTYARWVPSATGLGIAGVVPAYNSISMFLGSLAAWIWMRADAKSGEKYIIAGSSGMIAGESLMGVAVNLTAQGPSMCNAIVSSIRGMFGH